MSLNEASAEQEHLRLQKENDSFVYKKIINELCDTSYALGDIDGRGGDLNSRERKDYKKEETFLKNKILELLTSEK